MRSNLKRNYYTAFAQRRQAQEPCSWLEIGEIKQPLLRTDLSLDVLEKCRSTKIKFVEREKKEDSSEGRRETRARVPPSLARQKVETSSEKFYKRRSTKSECLAVQLFPLITVSICAATSSALR
jgi:hypothetical protein